MAEDCPVPRNASAWRLRAIVVDRRVSQRFWLKSARARRFFRSQRPRYFGIVPGTTAKARPPFITLFLDSSGSKSARAGRGSAIAAAGAIPYASASSFAHCCTPANGSPQQESLRPVHTAEASRSRGVNAHATWHLQLTAAAITRETDTREHALAPPASRHTRARRRTA